MCPNNHSCDKSKMLLNQSQVKGQGENQNILQSASIVAKTLTSSIYIFTSGIDGSSGIIWSLFRTVPGGLLGRFARRWKKMLMCDSDLISIHHQH